MEEKLPTHRSVELYQQLISDLPERREPEVLRPARLPTCPACQRLGLNTSRVARPGGRWACDRGHGLLEPSA